MASFASEFRKVQMVLFDQFLRRKENPHEIWMLARASREIPKDQTIVIVDSDLRYGNARALAIDLAKELSFDELIFLAQDRDGLEWGRSRNLNSHIFDTKKDTESSWLWDKLLRAKVTVYDTHDWWRTHNQLLTRALLEGSKKIQLWHGATGPVGKVFGLERLNAAPSWWHFVAVASSSGYYDALVNEPSQAEYRRNRSMIAGRSILDVEYRLVEAMKMQKKGAGKRVLVAPTYSESVAGEDALIAWMSQVLLLGDKQGWQVDVAVHPGSKPRVARTISRGSGNSTIKHGIETAELVNYSAVVTDFSGIAHDAIMCNVPTVSVLVDFENYRELCPSLVDDDQMNVAYVAYSLEDIDSMITSALNVDPKAELRSEYVSKVLDQIGNKPGVNTTKAVLEYLNS